MGSSSDDYDSSSHDDMLHLQSMTPEEQLQMLQEKLRRTTKFLHEIQTLSPACEEATDSKEKQVRKRSHKHFLNFILWPGAFLL